MSEGVREAVLSPSVGWIVLGLFSVVTLLTTSLGHQARLRVSAAAWYRKTHPTFSDTLAAVRRPAQPTAPGSGSRG